MVRYGNRIRLGLSVLTGLFLLATLFAVLFYALTPPTPAARAPLLLTGFIAILIGSLVCILLLLRWLMRPYRQLLGEAERASLTAGTHDSKDEAAFVLETFQSVVAQLQTQRTELEKLSAQARERADSAEKFSERIVASVPSGLVAFDGNGRSMAINAPGRALLELDGKAMGEPFHALLRSFPALADLVEQCLQTGQLYRREEVEAYTAEGLARRIGATVAPIDLSSERGGRGALCLLTDITEVTQLREQVALKRNLESLGEMSAGLAHEFKNAIATLHGYVQLLQHHDLDDKARATTSSLLNEVRNLSEMVTSFLNFARPQPLDLDTISLPELLEECAAELRSLYADLRVELVLPTAAEALNSRQPPRQIRADERMLHQALLNLLRNAAEAIPADHTSRYVKVSHSLELDKSGKEWTVIEIEDSGEGIPTSDLQRIFIPFFTTKAKGHGVGLALAHRVIAEHGGSLTASNAKTGGAVFTLRLPLET
jgi:nitrogen fixation/metabolism regulation signal transduction histidine kinase